jgi:hypothetical protein
MELTNIEKLIEKYENAETSLKEEAVLKTYFSQDKVAPHLEEYKAMFIYFKESKEERFTKTIPLRKKTSNTWWLSIAASVALIFSVYFVNRPSGLSASEQKEAEMALLETQKAFQLISENLNKGENVAMAGLSEFEKAQNKVFKVKK